MTDWTSRPLHRTADTSVEDNVLAFAAAQVAVGELTGHEAEALGADGVRLLVKNVEHDVLTRRLRAFAGFFTGGPARPSEAERFYDRLGREAERFYDRLGREAERFYDKADEPW